MTDENKFLALLWLSLLVVGLPPCRFVFYPRPVRL